MIINPRIKTKSGYTRLQRTLFSSVLAALLLALLSACTLSKQAPKKLKDVQYAIVEENEIPEKLLETIEQKKAAEFKLSFENEGELYIVHGYGEQETGGYSIVVRNCYLTKNAIYFDTELLGPQNGSNPQKKPSYPYIVVKTKAMKQNIVFE